VLVCGSREWSDYGLIKRMLSFVDAAVVIEGGCRGADALARRAAEELGLPIVEFPAEWGRYGRAAGPMRNERMLREGKPDLVLAFCDSAGESRGTRDMIRRSTAAGIPVIITIVGRTRHSLERDEATEAKLNEASDGPIDSFSLKKGAAEER